MRFLPVLLGVVSVLVLFTGLDRTGLVDQREARDAQVANELVDEREPLTPLLGKEPLFEKPILAYAPEVAIRMISDNPDVRSASCARAGRDPAAHPHRLGRSPAFRRSGGLVLGAGARTSLALPLGARTDGTQLFATLFGWVGAAGFADALFGRRERVANCGWSCSTARSG